MKIEKMSVKTTSTRDFVDITDRVSGAVKKAGVSGGIALVYCPHTTAAVTINENADPAVMTDIDMKTTKLVERDDPDYRHAEGNSDGHVKSSLFGASEAFIIEDGGLLLGTWQGIYLAEFDGPRTRQVFVKIVEG